MNTHLMISTTATLEVAPHRIRALTCTILAALNLLNDGQAAAFSLDPRVVGSYDTDVIASGVTVAGNHAYLAVGEEGLQIIDIADPTNLRLVGSVDTPGSAMDVAVSGNYAYVADGRAGLQVIDLSDPTSPARTGGYETSSSCLGIVLLENRAYLANGGAGLEVIDITNPAQPESVANVNLAGFAFGITRQGDHLYVAGGGAGLQVINIINPANPNLVGQFNSKGFALGVAVNGNHAYLADDFAGLQIVDITVPEDPQHTGEYNTRGNALAVAALSGYAFVVASGVELIDVADAAQPLLVGSNTAFAGSSIVVRDSHVFLAAGEDGLVLYDVSFPSVRLEVSQNGEKQLKINVSGSAGLSVQIQRSQNLVDWEDWESVTLDEITSEVTDTDKLPRRFYRAIGR